MPSLTYGLGFDPTPKRSRLVSFSVKSQVGVPSASNLRSPSAGCDADTPPPSSARLREGLGPSALRDHSLRNQIVGSTCSVAASGPRLLTVIRMSRSSGDAFAYS